MTDPTNPLANAVRHGIDRRAALTGEPNSEQRDRAAAIERAREAELERDAMRWRGLMASARIRIMGWAGMPDRKAGADYMHMGIEVWSIHDAADDQRFPQDDCRQQLAAYADAMAARIKP